MAEFGSSEAGKKGGKARAAKMSKKERTERASVAAAARWGKDLPVATHGDDDHPLRIPNGDSFIEIPCYVLDDGRRVLIQSGMLKGLAMSQGTAGRGHGDRLGRFIATKSIKPFVDNDLVDVITEPIKFRGRNGSISHGYEATVLADLCDAVLEARNSETGLNYQQEHIAKQCEILVRGFARVGIIALVDAATGYERSRERDELAKILEAFVAKELQKWLPTFDLDFYEELCRLRREPLARAKKRPQYFGLLTNNLVYERLAPGVKRELEKLNPVCENGRRKNKHHQYLTPQIGHPKLKEHLAGVTSAMKFANAQGLSWDQFMELIDKTHPKWKPMPLFDDQDEQPAS